MKLHREDAFLHKNQFAISVWLMILEPEIDFYFLKYAILLNINPLNSLAKGKIVF